MNILDKIIAHKRQEIAIAKAQTSIAELEKSPFFGRQGLSLKQRLLNLQQQAKAGIIAEFKRKSPSLGIINAQLQPEVVTRGYAMAGAAGLSVLTDTEFFGGNFGDFCRARAVNPNTPMLRKDFMVDEYQLWEAKGIGADVILLIAACLTPSEIQQLAARTHELGMEVLLEVHDHEELEISLCPEIDMVGVNNRNLKTFVTSIDTSLDLARIIPKEFIKISESGLKDAQTIRTLQQAGYQGFLIGETFMKTPNPAQALTNLVNELH